MLWLKAFHIIAVVSWFAGMFYLPRLLVNYAASEHPQTRQQLTIMARKLYRFVTPIAVVAVVLGLLMMANNWQYYLDATWMRVKLLAVVMLLIYHYLCGRHVDAIEKDQSKHSETYFRVFNEIPVLFLVLVVIMVVVKPF